MDAFCRMVAASLARALDVPEDLIRSSARFSALRRAQWARYWRGVERFRRRMGRVITPDIIASWRKSKSAEEVIR